MNERKADKTEMVDPPPVLVRDLMAAGLVSATSCWTVLPGGRTNQVWNVTDKDVSRVVKLYTPCAETPLFRNDPQAEAMVLDVLKGSGLAPKPVFSGILSSGPVLIYEHQAGSPWRSDVDAVAHVLKSLHARPCPTSLRALAPAPDGAAALVAQTRAILDQTPSEQAAAIRALEPRSEVLPSGQLCVLHGDPVPDNLICPDGAHAGLPVLIDWQCPALGDPILDLALFLSPAMQQICRGKPLTAQERASFLTAYGDGAATARLTALQPILHWRMAAYCLWKITRPTPDPSYSLAMDQEIEALQRLAV